MTWTDGICLVVALIVCAELYALRDSVNQLHKKVDELNERLSRKRIEELMKEDEQ